MARTCVFWKYTEFSLMLTSNLQGLLQNQSLETILICNVVLIFPQQYCLYSHVWWVFATKRAKRLSHALVHFVTARATLFTDQKYKSTNTCQIQTFQNNLGTNCGLYSYWLNFFFKKKLMVIHDGVVTFESFYWPIRNTFPHISLHDLPCPRTMKTSFRPCLSDILFECNPNKHSREIMLVLPSQRLSW